MDDLEKQLPPTDSPPLILTRKPKRRAIKIILVVLFLGVVSTGIVLATRMWDPFWNPFRPRPEKVIALMFEKMTEPKSVHSEIKFKMETKEKKEENMLKGVVINFSGDSDNSDINNAKGEGEVEIANSFGSEQSFYTKTKIKMLGRTEGYFNIEEFNAPSFAPTLLMMGINLDNLKGTWIKIPIEDKLGQGANEQTAVLTEQMRKIMSESKIYVVKKQLTDQTIEGKKMYHYLVALNNEELIKLIGDLMKESMEQSELKEAPETMYVSAIKGIILEFLDKVGEINIELLIGKRDNLLYGFKMEKNIDLNKLNKENEGSVKITVEVKNSRFNQPVKIEAPANFKKWEEVFRHPSISPSFEPMSKPELQ